MYGFSDHLNPIPLTGLSADLHGSSRYSTRMAKMIEQTFVPLANGVRRLTLPLPTGPKHVHCYLVDGTLFDTGLGLGDAPWASAAIERIAITHLHPDHVGGAAAAAGRPEHPSTRAASTTPSASGCGGATTGPNGSRRGFGRHGVPAAVADDLIEQGHAFAAFVRYALDPEPHLRGQRPRRLDRRSSCRGTPTAISASCATASSSAATTCSAGSRRRRPLSREPARSARRLPRVARAHDRARSAHRLSGTRRADRGRRPPARAS